MAKKIFTIIILFLLAPLFFGVLFGFTFRATLANPDFVKKELADFGAYEKVYRNFPEIADMMTKKGQEGGGVTQEGGEPEKLPMFTKEESTSFFQRVFTPAELKIIAEGAIDSIWPWLFGGQEKMLPAEVTPIKQKVQAELMNTFRAKYEALPLCPYGQTEFSGDMTSCRPRGVSFDDTVKYFKEQKGISPDSIVNSIPDNVDPNTYVSRNADLAPKVASINQSKPLIRAAFFGFYVLAVILLVILVFLARMFGGEWGKAPKAFGILLIISGGLSFLYGFLGIKIVLPRIILLTDQINVMPILKKELITPLVDDIVSKVYGVFVNYIYIMIAVGVIFIVGSLVYELFARWHTRRAGWSLKNKTEV